MQPEIVDALRDVGITEPFPIQEMTLSVGLTGADLIGQARTGTGKTLAFAIPVCQRTVAPGDRDAADIAAPGKPQALIIAPTRELAQQVAGDVEVAASNRGLRVLTIYGGVPYEPQLDALSAGVDIVVGTPGRLLDLADRRALDLSHVKSLVLDEADEMLDLGFLPDVERILAKTPELRQTMLFSATMPSAIVTLARRHMRHPVNIRAESSSEEQYVPTTAQFIYWAHDLDKPEVVARILQAEGRGKTIVFTRTKRQAQRVADDLAERGFPSSPLHGDMAQVAREKAMARFRDGTIDILVATDVAARGIDVSAVTHVINYTCPEDDKNYLHRIGRTGRAGASGIAITFVDWPDLARWKMINTTLGLPFEEPQETYSTSEHIYHDLGIPRGATGRIVPLTAMSGSLTPGQPSGRSGSGKDRPARSRTSSGSGRTEPEGRRRPAGERQRRRTRSGQPVDAADAALPATQAGNGSAPAPASAVVEGSVADAPRRRRRRRSRGSGGTGTTDTSVPTSPAPSVAVPVAD
ncbi:MAG: ATP-dependent RNA helicase [uncultured Nocardioidaceae bacterium]|uniref:RNA helicase n=1 Tax=uncultured Nocardioidaceae bacterium TaxID=253824 RepID=A0A6J4LAC3_9ACTN|nr:MAG: ATP-dependent RNA helicase [uncultured Nocardioidaceae bacterium]